MTTSKPTDQSRGLAERVDVIIPCRDAGSTLPATLRSVHGQTVPPNEILVVDDGSSDESTLELLATLVPPVRVVRGRGAGPGAARNAGFAESSAEFLLVLDADDLILSTFVSRTREALLGRPGLGFAYSDLEYFGERRGVHRQHPYNFHDQLFRNQVTTCALVRREAWAATGGYSEEMSNGGEDWEFFVSLGAAGWHGVRVPEALFRYRVRTGTLSARTRQALPDIARFIRSRHPDLYSEASIDRVRRQWKGTWKHDDPDSIPFRARRFLSASDRPRVVREALERRGWSALARALARPWAAIRHGREFARTSRDAWRPVGSPEARRQRAVAWFSSHDPSERIATVVVTCKDDGEYLPDMLLSLAEQELTGFEIIIVDDGSVDAETVGLLDELSAVMSEYARVVRRPQSDGLAVARNEGIRTGQAPFVACVDADDVLDPRFLSTSIERLRGDEDLGYAYFDYRKFGTVEDLVIAPEFDLRDLIRDNFVPACAPFRRQAWVDAGGYDESMSGGFEDWDFWLRLAERGWMGDRIPTTLFYYRRRRGSLVEGAVREKERWAKHIRERHRVLFERLESDPGAGS